MIEGVVSAALEAVVSLRLQGTDARVRDVEAVIETGFSRYLTLPSRLVRELDAPFLGVSRVALASGREAALDVHGVTVLWDDRLIDVDVLVVETAPLVGMALLDRHTICVDVRAGGRIVIEPLGATDRS